MGVCVFHKWKECNSPSDIGESLDLAAMVFVSDTARDIDKVGEDLGTGEETFKNKLKNINKSVNPRSPSTGAFKTYSIITDNTQVK